MKKLSISLLLTAAPLLFFNAFQKNSPDSNGTTIVVERKKSKQRLTDLICPTGAMSLQNPADAKLQSIEKVVFDGDEIFVLDNLENVDQVLVFDKNDGSLLRKIGEQGRAVGQFDALENFTIEADKITLLSAGKRAFFNYDKAGNLLDTVPIGLVAEAIETAPNGNILVYNENSSAAVASKNHLLVFDKNQKLIEKHFSFKEMTVSRRYQYTGFLSESDGAIWFSPPFCPTVFRVSTTGKTSPCYTFDFGENQLPQDWRNSIFSRNQLLEYGFINQNFVKTGRFIQVNYSLKKYIGHGLFDERTKQFVDLLDLQTDCLYPLILHGTIVSKDSDEFVLILQTERLQRILKDKKFDKQALNQQLDNLGDKLAAAAEQDNPMLISFSFKAGAAVVFD